MSALMFGERSVALRVTRLIPDLRNGLCIHSDNFRLILIERNYCHRGGADVDAQEEVERRSNPICHGGFDRIAVSDEGNGIGGMQLTEAKHFANNPHLGFNHDIPARRLGAAAERIPSLPMWDFIERGNSLVGPLTEADFVQAFGDYDFLTE